MIEDDWLGRLKEGDTVIVRSRHGRSVCTVDKVGKIHIFVGGDRYNKRGVHRIDSYSHRTLEQATAESVSEVRKENRRANLIRRLHKTDWSKLPTEALVEIEKLSRQVAK